MGGPKTGAKDQCPVRNRPYRQSLLTEGRQKHRHGKVRVAGLDKVPEGQFTLLFGAAVGDVGVIALARLLATHGKPCVAVQRALFQLLWRAKRGGVDAASHGNGLEFLGMVLR
jgi:hypothetical protein